MKKESNRTGPPRLRLGRRIASKLFRMTPQEEVEREFDFHIEMRIRDNLADGMSWDKAQRDAVERFGDLERVKSVCSDLAEQREGKMKRREWTRDWLQDLRFAFRQIRKRPGFAVVAVLTLAIAIGANTAVFSVVNGVLLEPLPYYESNRLVQLFNRYLPESGYDVPRFPLSLPEIVDYRDQTEAIESVGYYQSWPVSIMSEGASPQRVIGAWVNKDVLPLLGVRPAMGRWFSPVEDLPGGPRSAILSHPLWRDRFGSDPGVLGRMIVVDGVETKVIGVMPAGFGFPREEIRLYLSLRANESAPGGRGNHGRWAIGRLAPGQTIETATVELETMMAGWAQKDEHHVGHAIYPVGLRDSLVGGVRETLWALMATVVLVLLIAASNMANLMLARGESRTREISLRLALGANRGRVIRQLLTESVVLAAIGGVLGVGLAWLGLRAVVAINPAALPRMNEVGLSLSVLAFTAIATLGTALLFGLFPALQAGRRAEVSGLASVLATDGVTKTRFRQFVVAAEVALCLIVVLTAGLVVRSYRALMEVDPGMEVEGILTFGVSLPSSVYQSPESALRFYDRFLERLRALPGADEASFSWMLPLLDGGHGRDIVIEGRALPRQGEARWQTAHYVVQPGYLETMGIPLKSGRTLKRTDGPGSRLVAVISEEAARVFWPGENPIGKRFGYDSDDPSLVTIIGVAGDVKTGTLESESPPQVYVLQNQTQKLGLYTAREGHVVVRTLVAPESLVSAVRRLLAELDPTLPMEDVRTMSDVIDTSVARPRLAASLLGSLALIALIMAAIGVFGVVSYSVARRTREIGIRMALGADNLRVVLMMVRSGAGPALLGVIIGLAAAFGATSAVEGLLFGVSRTDPLTFTVIPLTLVSVATVASWIPSRRATRIQAIESLRSE